MGNISGSRVGGVSGIDLTFGVGIGVFDGRRTLGEGERWRKTTVIILITIEGGCSGRGGRTAGDGVSCSGFVLHKASLDNEDWGGLLRSILG